MTDPTITVDPDGTIHASIDIDLSSGETPAADASSDGPDEQPATNEATDALGNIITGTVKTAAKAAGTVLGTIWDVLKPDGSPAADSDQDAGEETSGVLGSSVNVDFQENYLRM